jgi:hypothetical protein
MKQYKFITRTVIFGTIAALSVVAFFVFISLTSNQRNRTEANVLSSDRSAAVRFTEHTIESTSSPSEEMKLPATSKEILLLLLGPGHRLNAMELKSVLKYLKKPIPAETPMNPAAEYYNNIIAILLAQPSDVAGFSEALVTVVSDQGIPVLLRNYAMQHFFHCWNREGDLVMREALEQSLKRHAQDTTSPLQDVALITASRFFEQGKPVKGPNGEKLIPIGSTPAPNPLSISKPTSFTDVELVASALRVTSDLAAAPKARVSAFNVLLNMEVRQAIDPARQVLQSANTPDEVRCSALAVLGTFGDLATDRRDLDAIPVQPEDVRKAADFAFNKLLQFSQTKP